MVSSSIISFNSSLLARFHDFIQQQVIAIPPVIGPIPALHGFLPVESVVVVVVFELVVAGMSFALWSLILGLGIEGLPFRNSAKK
ncbi:hypothetical protein ACFU8X_14345 [Brevibacillus porteri]|uniref:hypothetical protein n=1 Tax=Brevibacillus porteri TaxID=2126350 RepID=UPI00370B12D8